MQGRTGARVIIALAVLVAVLFVGYQFFYQWSNLRALNAQKAELQSKLDTVNGKNDALKQEIKDSGSDSFVERMARELLGWVKPGEIKIVDEDNK